MNKDNLYVGMELWSQCGGYTVEVIETVYEKNGLEFFKVKRDDGKIEEILTEFLYEYTAL